MPEMIFWNQKYRNDRELKKAHNEFNDNMERGWKNYPHIKRKLETIQREVPAGCVFLDVGCNSGEISRMLIETNGIQSHAVDLCPELVIKAKEKGVGAIEGSAEKLPFPDNMFDCVWLGEIIEHTYHPEKMLSEAKRVLKTGGMLLGSTLNEVETYAMRGSSFPGWDDERLHARTYSNSQMRDLVSKIFPNAKVYNVQSNGIYIFFKGFKQ